MVLVEGGNVVGKPGFGGKHGGHDAEVGGEQAGLFVAAPQTERQQQDEAEQVVDDTVTVFPSVGAVHEQDFNQSARQHGQPKEQVGGFQTA